ncbi:cell division protein FtsK [Parafrankia discariae]|uniref:cell division protein FtsK n=1 Tax=Parafrankia discariae TaxID=365528 RepID=UPI0003A78DF9|nr:cell division protein FtsK [Parafrankia discariae]
MAENPSPSDPVPGWIPDIAAARAEFPAVPNAESYAVELDTDTPMSGTVVDLPTPVTGQREGERRAIVPDSLRWAQLPATVRHAGGFWAHVALFHTVRAPWYVLVALRAALVGAGRLLSHHIRWIMVEEASGLRQAAAGGDASTWLSLHRTVHSARKRRVLVALGEIAAIGCVMTMMPPLWHSLPTLGRVVLVIGILAPLIVAGRPRHGRLIPPAVVTPRFRRLTADIVLRAYYAAKLGDPEKPGQQITFGSAMARDGDGSRVLVDLPYGRGFGDATKSHAAIASGLDVATSQVFLSPDRSSTRRHVLWVADRDPLAIPAGRTPLLKLQETDIWKPAPMGLDERGGNVFLDLMWNSILVGAQPRKGKSFTLRHLGLYAAADPYVKLSVFDASGRPDWRGFTAVADRCSFGMAMTRDGDPIDLLVETLREIKRDVEDRYLRLSEMPPSMVPEGKLTRTIARDPSYGMPVRILILDEFQLYFSTGNTDTDREIADLLVYLIRVAPAAGVIIGSATQRPSGIGSGGEVSRRFTDYRDNHILRFALKTGSYVVSDLVLGSGAYSEGLDSSTLDPEYKGVGILRGAMDHSPTVRTYLADAEDSAKILTAARERRAKLGTLTGQAAGIPFSTTIPTRNVLEDVAAIFGEDSGLHWPEISERLARRFPEHYADVNAEVISVQCRALGVPSVNVKRAGTVLKGARADAVRSAFQRAPGVRSR